MTLGEKLKEGAPSFAQNARGDPERRTVGAVERRLGCREVELPCRGAPEENTQRPMHFERSLLRDNPGSAVVREEPVGLLIRLTRPAL